MSSVSAIATSGIRAASQRLQVAAANIAKATDGAGGACVLRVNQVDVVGGGTKATVGTVSKAVTADAGSDLTARTAAAWEFRANPYVALTNEMVQALVARFALATNAQILHADAQTSAKLLDLKV